MKLCPLPAVIVSLVGSFLCLTPTALSHSGDRGAADISIQPGTYKGHGVYDKNLQIEFEVKRTGDGFSVSFRADKLKFHCQDGTTFRRSGFRVKTALRPSDRGFQEFNYSSLDGDFLNWVAGAISENGERGRGSLFSLSSPADPPDGTGGPTCSTGDKVIWIARRTR